VDVVGAEALPRLGGDGFPANTYGLVSTETVAVLATYFLSSAVIFAVTAI